VRVQAAEEKSRKGRRYKTGTMGNSAGRKAKARSKKKQIPFGDDRPWGGVAARGAAMRGCDGRRVEVEILRPPGGGLRMTST
jgi:hypothetical protein